MDIVWTLLIITLKSLALLVGLLIFVAYILMPADRKIWRPCHLRRGPNVVGPWGLLQSFRGFSEICAAADHPGWRQQGRLHPCAFGDGHVVDRRLGGHSGGQGCRVSPTSMSAFSIFS